MFCTWVILLLSQTLGHIDDFSELQYALSRTIFKQKPFIIVISNLKILLKKLWRQKG